MKASMILDGSLSSTTMLAQLIKEGRDIAVLSINTGKTPSKQTEAIKAVAEYYGVNLQHIDATNVAYMYENRLTGLLQSTSFLVAMGIQNESDIFSNEFRHSSDAIFPATIAKGIFLVSNKKMRLQTPYLRMTMDLIVRVGVELNVPFELTWSCKKDGEIHCGECDSCLRRREAFLVAKYRDPVEMVTDPVHQTIHYDNKRPVEEQPIPLVSTQMKSPSLEEAGTDAVTSDRIEPHVETPPTPIINDPEPKTEPIPTPKPAPVKKEEVPLPDVKPTSVPLP